MQGSSNHDEKKSKKSSSPTRRRNEKKWTEKDAVSTSGSDCDFENLVSTLEEPEMVISVNGGAKDFSLSQSAETTEKVFQGIMKAYDEMKVWFVSGGTDSGVMRMLGENRKKFAPRAPLIGIALRSMIKGVDREDFKLKMSENPNAQNDDTRIRLISVEKKKKLKSDNNIEEVANNTEQEDLTAEYELKSFTKKIEHDDSKAEYNLEPHHTHFFLVEEPKEKNNSVEQSRRARACFEKVIRNRKGNRRWAWSFKRHGDLEKVPYVCVCIEGGVGCISQVYLVAMEGMAVLCVKGTGRAAFPPWLSSTHAFPFQPNTY